MKKFLLFVSTVFFSLFLINNKVFAQEFTTYTYKLNPSSVSFVQENANTYEYRIYYNIFNDVYSGIDISNYYLVTNYYLQLERGINRNFNTYEITDVSSPPQLSYTIIELTVTLAKYFVNENYSNVPGDDNYIYNFFRDDSALYVSYVGSSSSIDYYNGYDDGFEVGRESGYSDGYNTGYNAGYNIGYNAGINVSQYEAYQRGYNDGYEYASNEAPKKFMSNLHVWIVPAVIVVVIAGIFVGYRRERHWND